MPTGTALSIFNSLTWSQNQFQWDKYSLTDTDIPNDPEALALFNNYQQEITTFIYSARMLLSYSCQAGNRFQEFSHVHLPPMLQSLLWSAHSRISAIHMKLSNYLSTTDRQYFAASYDFSWLLYAFQLVPELKPGVAYPNVKISQGMFSWGKHSCRF